MDRVNGLFGSTVYIIDLKCAPLRIIRMLAMVFGIMYVGAIGIGLFSAGISLSITPLTATGIALIIAAILGIIIYHLCFGYTETRSHIHAIQPVPNPFSYSTNNMNTMKRNKSDTDLELINRQASEMPDLV